MGYCWSELFLFSFLILGFRIPDSRFRTLVFGFHIPCLRFACCSDHEKIVNFQISWGMCVVTENNYDPLFTVLLEKRV